MIKIIKRGGEERTKKEDKRWATEQNWETRRTEEETPRRSERSGQEERHKQLALKEIERSKNQHERVTASQLAKGTPQGGRGSRERESGEGADGAAEGGRRRTLRCPPLFTKCQR